MSARSGTSGMARWSAKRNRSDWTGKEWQPKRAGEEGILGGRTERRSLAHKIILTERGISPDGDDAAVNHNRKMDVRGTSQMGNPLATAANPDW
jgi:hypothetical protein